MKSQKLYLVWGALFIVCAGFGFIREPQGLVKAIMVLLSAAFFVPPAALLYRGSREPDRKKLVLVRNVSLAALAVGLTMLVANFLSVMLPAWAGDLLYSLMVVLTAPMVCCQYWAVSLFVWACLLMTSLHLLKK